MDKENKIKNTKEGEMKTTYTRAKRIVMITGDYDRAWEIARQDEGLKEEVTKGQWIAWMKSKR